MIKSTITTGIFLLGLVGHAGEILREPHRFFREEIGLNDRQIAMIDQGKPVVKILSSIAPSEIIVFGSVFIKGSPEDFVKLSFDMTRLQKSPSYLGAGRISDPPALSNLDGFTLEPEDIKNLRTCKPGKCNVQLPSAIILELQRSIDWSAPDVETQVNHRIKEMAVEILRRYQKEGNRALGGYSDKGSPFYVDAELRLLLGRSNTIISYLPELSRYILEYPNMTLDNIESFFFWEKVSFGLKPTLRLNHAISYRARGLKTAPQIVMVKQLYASHYLQLALDLTACVPSADSTKSTGFYLISVRGSSQQGLTGFWGSILKSVIVSRTRSAQEKLLINIKYSLEAD